MALQPVDLIADATGLAFPFISEYGVAPGQLLRHLTTLDDEIVNMFATSAPERLSLPGTTITIVAANNAAGYALTDARAYTDFRYIDSNGVVWTSPIVIVPESRFDSPDRDPAGIIRNNAGVSTFYPCDPFRMNWLTTLNVRPFFVGDGDQVKYRYIPALARVTTLTQTLLSPEEARPYIMWSLAATILMSHSTTPELQPQVANRVQAALAMAGAAKQSLQLIAYKRSPTSSRANEGF